MKAWWKDSARTILHYWNDVLAALLIAVLVFLVSCPALGEWVEVTQVKQTNIPGFLGDLEKRMPSQHVYRDADKVTWAHETTHGINSVLRGYYPECNVFYVGDGKCFVLKEPPIRLSNVQAAVGHDRKIPKDSTFDLYLVRMQKHWNNKPLYVLDELVAYMNGTVVGIQTGSPRFRVVDSLGKAEKFYAYALHLGRLAEKSDYPKQDLAQLGEFLTWCRDRLDNIHQHLAKGKDDATPTTSGDCTSGKCPGGKCGPPGMVPVLPVWNSQDY